MFKNIFYFNEIKKIGGTEQYLYEIAKKYHLKDITVFYSEADYDQLRRLKKLVRCEKFKGPIQCEKAFYNFNIGIIDEVEAKEHIFVDHAIYQIIGGKPPVNHPKITKIISVSEFAKEMLKEYTYKPIEVCYNPLTIEPKEEVKILVSAGRLDDKVKGGQRTLRLISALDEYAKEHNKHYLWMIFTNPVSFGIDSPNVVIMKPRIDVRPYIANADYVLQLSDDMETYCYTINEALSYGVPIVTTPLSILNELPITDNEHIVLNWDCENVDEVAKQIFEKKIKPFEYKPPEDNWGNILAKGKTTYKYEPFKKIKARVKNIYWDATLKRTRLPNEIVEITSEETYDNMIKQNLIYKESNNAI